MISAYLLLNLIFEWKEVQIRNCHLKLAAVHACSLAPACNNFEPLKFGMKAWKSFFHESEFSDNISTSSSEIRTNTKTSMLITVLSDGW